MHIDEETIFHEALSRDDAQNRARYLDEVCAGDTNLKSRMLALLEAYTSSEFLESTPAEVNAFLTAGHHDNLEGSQVGPYFLQELLGEGGMGEVYLAERRNGGTRSLVALKVIKLGMDSRQVLARFHLEQEALRRLDHPNIAQFLDAGVADTGRLYFAMELVEGMPITQYCDRERLPILERLKLFIETCQAVAHAHEKGIVHRDLKPANVLVSVLAGMPIVKVIDFGVAKALEDSLISAGPHTRATQIVGTPSYMSPEQARWSSDVDLRTDVYSLGALLYELLTGSTLMRREAANQVDPSELRHKIQTEEPPWPSHRIAQLDPEELERVCTSRATQQRQLVRQIRGDLDWIALKALELDREQRYASPALLAADLAAFLEHRPIAARGPSLASRLSKWTKHHRNLLSRTTAIVMVAFVAIGLVWITQTFRSDRNKHRETESARLRFESELAHNEFVRDILQTAAFLRAGDSPSAERLLDHYSHDVDQPYADHFAVGYLRSQIPKPVQVFEGHQHNLLDMDTSARWIASGDRGGDIILWDRTSAREVHRLHPSDMEVTRIRFSPDGRILATAGQDRLVRLWNVDAWTPVGEMVQHERTINGLAWSPDSRQIASGDRDGVVCIWNVESLTCQEVLPRHVEPVRCLAWSLDGKRVATADGDQGVRVWDTKTWSQTGFIPNDANKGILAIAFSTDSQYMAFGGYMGELVVVDLATDSRVKHTQALFQIWSLAFGNRNELIAGRPGFLQLFQHSWEKQSWQSVRVVDVASSGSRHRSLAYSADKQFLYIASEEDRLIKTLPMASVTGYAFTELDSVPIGVIPKLDYLVCASRNGGPGTVRRATNNAFKFQLPIPVEPLCIPEYSSAANLLAVASRTPDRGQVYVFHASTCEIVASLEFPTLIEKLSFSRDGKFLVLTGYESLVRIWNLHTNDYRDLTNDVKDMFRSMAVFSPTSDVLVHGLARTETLTCLQAVSLEEIRTVSAFSRWNCLHYSPDGNFLVVGDEDRISVWTSDLARMLWTSTIASSAAYIKSVSFSPDRRTIAILLRDGTVKFWDLQSRSELFSVPPPNPGGDYRWISFTDSATLLLGTESESKIFSLSAAALPFTRLNSASNESVHKDVEPSVGKP